MKTDIGLIGLAVMGENLALNIESKGFSVAVYEREAGKAARFLSGRGKGKKFAAANTLKELAESVKTPRRIMMMIKAGKPVDDTIDALLPFLDGGDIIIDGGNSNFNDTARRTAYLESKGLLFIGTGVSGGEQGALNGPSVMPGGSFKAWEAVKPVLTAIAAKTDGQPCCDWVGSGGAGHFVKMVHNGIEYGDMELICEAYDLMRKGLGMSAAEIGAVFAEWNKGELESYLIEITRDILLFGDGGEKDGKPLVDKILDKAGQKGTGKWTVNAALDEGLPLTLIGEAVFARCLSAQKDERVRAEKAFNIRRKQFAGDKAKIIGDIRKALYLSKIISYAQGFALMRSAAKTFDWKLDYGKIALMWRGGCIIRSVFLGDIKRAFDSKPKLENLLLDRFFKKAAKASLVSLRKTCSRAALSGIPAAAFTAALAYFDGYTSGALPHNLLQAQRDYFGAHTYERVDKPAGEFFHTDWTGEGGNTTSNNYVV